jgi:hypothetical protein
MQQSRRTHQNHDDANVQHAAEQGLAGDTPVAFDDDLEGGKRADGAAKGRVTPVNYGHSRLTTDTRKAALTRDATL